MSSDNHLNRLLALVRGALHPEPGLARIALALSFGLIVHLVFTVAVFAMYFGVSRSFGAVPPPYALLSNAILIVQFPLVHSRLLTDRGTRWLRRIVPAPFTGTLSTTTYAIIYMGIAHKGDRPGHQ